jgi:hypothetical protein
LDPRHKCLQLVFVFINHEQGVAVVEKYCKNSMCSYAP